ncbi:MULTISPECIES: SDR family oxidoreductase [unclassified Spirillospora]|uniref:SDR family oxidoreductase n=1 Tax=unclassified Spirillospora TaxID=2642701 RepID=UPI003714D7C5
MSDRPSPAAYLSGLFSLEGRVAVVTGGSSGIGRAIAGAAVFLASASAAYVTGQSIFVDGGFSAH